MTIFRNSLSCCVVLGLILRTFAITNRIEHKHVGRNSRRHISNTAPADWEVGLREATYQALIREGVSDSHLKGQIFAAPLLGKQDSAQPFGDIIVLARGQLYNTHDGFKFVQDPYQNDCDDCHNKQNRCGRHQCDVWRPNQHQQLLGLWTVKKLRHRSAHGHRYEIEYIISPINADRNQDFITKNGRFDYTLPGHVFLVKNTPRYIAYPNNNDIADVVYTNQATQTHPSVIYDHDHNGYNSNGQKYLVHGYPDYLPPYQSSPSTNDPKEIELYKQLLQSLSSKTSTSHGPQRFELNDISSIPEIPTKGTYSTKPTFKPDTFRPETTYVPVTSTLVQLPTGQIVPVSQGQYHPITTSFPTSHAPVPSTRPNVPPTRPTQFVSSQPDITYSQPDPYLNTKPVIHTTYFIPQTETPTRPYQQITTPKRPNYSSTAKKPLTTFATTEKFKTTTIKQTIPDIDYEDFQSSLFPETTSSQKPAKPTSPAPVKETTEHIEDTEFHSELFSDTTTKVTQKPTTISEDLFPEKLPTEPQRPITQAPLEKPYPDSINEQLPPPANTDSTVPYATTTVTKKPIQAEETQQYENKQTTVRSVSSTTPIPSETINILTSQEISTTEATIPTTTVKYEEDSTTSLSTTRYYLPPRLNKSDKPTTQKEITTTQTSTTTEKETTHSKPQSVTVTTTQYQTEHSPPTTYYAKTTSTPYFTQSIIKEPTTGTVYYTTDLENLYEPTTFLEHTSTTRDPEYLYTQLNPDGTTTVLKTTNVPYTTLTYLGTTDDILTTPSKTTPPFKTTTKKFKTTTEASDFLADTNHKHPNKINHNQEISNDDIFGKTVFSSKPTQESTKKYSASELENDLFGQKRNAKLYKLRETNPTEQTTEYRTPKIIYSDFFEASTKPVHENFEEHTVEPIDNYKTTQDHQALTSQSYSTSISFEVNKKNHTGGVHENIQYEPTVVANLSEIENHSEYKVYKAELPETTSPTNNIKTEFDTIALQLVNHARTIDYLNKTKNKKYKRRRYTPRKKRTERKKR